MKKQNSNKLPFWCIFAVSQDNNILAELPLNDRNLVHKFVDRYQKQVISVAMFCNNGDQNNVHFVPIMSKEIKSFVGKENDEVYTDLSEFKTYLTEKINEQS